MLKREHLHAYQERCIETFKHKRRYALLLGMGLGKTVSSLTAVSDLLSEGKIQKVLVVAPLRVAASVWPTEVNNWEHLNHLSVSVCVGPERKRLAALHTTADVYTINRENLEWLVKLYGEDWPFDCVIIDESSSFKNPQSKRFKALRRVLPFTTHMLLLTGTPAPNSLMDVWAQFYLIDFGRALGRTMSGYKSRFFEKEGYMGYSYAIRPGAAAAIHKLIEPMAMSMSAEDYLELPERIDLVHQVNLPPAVLKKYQEFEKELLIEIDDINEIEAVNAAVLANKLLQFCNGALYTDDTGQYVEVHKAKLDALSDLVDDNPGENMLVAYSYQSDLERLRKRFPDAVVLDKDPATIERWNNGEISMLLAHPASAGHGLNLQRGGAFAIWFGLCWSLEYYQQFNARLHRQGQQNTVRIAHIIADGLLDQRVMRVLSQKDATQATLISALKA